MDRQNQLIADVVSATTRQRAARTAYDVAEAESMAAAKELQDAWSKLRLWQDEQVKIAMSGAIVGAPADPEAFG